MSKHHVQLSYPAPPYPLPPPHMLRSPHAGRGRWTLAVGLAAACVVLVIFIGWGRHYGRAPAEQTAATSGSVSH